MLTEPYSFEGPWSSTCRGSLPVQSTQERLQGLQPCTSTDKELLKATVLTLWDVTCATRNCSGKKILTQTCNPMPSYFFWFASKNLIMVPWYYGIPVSASTRTQKLQGKHQDTPPEISMKCFQLLFYPYSWNTKCTHRTKQHQLTADKQ